MTFHRALMVGAAVLLLASAPTAQGNKSPEARLRAAMDKETVDGDLKAAIDGYKQVISQSGASREIVARALLRLGIAYEKQGSAEARKSYERLVNEFGDQPTFKQQAMARMAAAGAAVVSGPTLRQVCSGSECPQGTVSQGRWVLQPTPLTDGRLTITDLSTRTSRVIANTPSGQRICCSVMSPDGTRVAYSVGPNVPGWPPSRETKVADADGGNSRTVYRGAVVVAWSSDGRRILALAGGQITTLQWVTVADGTAQPIPTTSWNNMDAFMVSPDGRYIAFSGNKDESVQENVFVIAADGSGETRISASPTYQEPVGWSPDGRYLLYAQYGTPVSLWAVPFTDGRVRGPALMIRQFGTERVSSLGMTPSGAVQYRILSATSDIYTASMDPATGRVTSLPAAVPTPSNGHNVSPRWSPDSRRLLYQSAGPNTTASAPRELRIISFEDGGDQRVAEKVTYGGDGPCWAPDGRSIVVTAVTATRPLREEPARVDLATGEARILFPGAATFRMRNCSDSLISGLQSGSIKVRNIQTGAETEVYRFTRDAANYGLPRISHNGRSVVFLESIDERTSAVMIVPSTGGTARALVRVTTPAEFQPLLGFAWSPDDRFVYFLRRANATAPHELFRVPAAGGAEEDMGLRGADLRDLDIAPDSRRIAFSIGAVGRPEIWVMENFLPTGK